MKKKKAYVPPTEHDELGRVIKKEIKDESPSRLSIAIALKDFASIMTPNELPIIIQFLIDFGFKDPKEEIRSKMLEVLICLFNLKLKLIIDN